MGEILTPQISTLKPNKVEEESAPFLLITCVFSFVGMAFKNHSRTLELIPELVLTLFF